MGLWKNYIVFEDLTEVVILFYFYDRILVSGAFLSQKILVSGMFLTQKILVSDEKTVYLPQK